ncbi:hypothetical protein JTB14_019243 [Gonioctena quinquepunctata]|nr:hypothetical protein JTB14_019243 [Gonioctena quinquepunctata]
MPDNGNSLDREESQGATGFDEGSTGLRDNPSGGDSLERELWRFFGSTVSESQVHISAGETRVDGISLQFTN